MNIRKIIIVSIILIIIAAPAYAYLDRSTIIDLEHHFMITDINGWQKVAPQESANWSLATISNNIIESYADVRYIPKEKDLAESTMIEIMRKTCNNLAQMEDMNATNIEMSEFKKDNAVVLKCASEIHSEKDSTRLQSWQYAYFGSKNEIVIVTTSYPIENTIEEMKVRKLIDGVKIW